MKQLFIFLALTVTLLPGCLHRSRTPLVETFDYSIMDCNIAKERNDYNSQAVIEKYTSEYESLVDARDYFDKRNQQWFVGNYLIAKKTAAQSKRCGFEPRFITPVIVELAEKLSLTVDPAD